MARPLDGLHERYERELGNDLGNLLSRVTAMIARYRDGDARCGPDYDSAVAGVLAPLGGDVAARLDAFDLSGALERIWEVVRHLNRFVESTAPWQLAKDEALPLRSIVCSTTSPTGCASSRSRSPPTSPTRP